MQRKDYSVNYMSWEKSIKLNPEKMFLQIKVNLVDILTVLVSQGTV